MPQPIRVELKDFLKWIHEQPKDKLVNMSEFHGTSHKCGCLMVQYGMEQGWQFRFCSSGEWIVSRDNIVAELVNNGKPTSVFQVLRDQQELLNEGKSQAKTLTYAQLIEIMKPEYRTPPQ